MNEITYHREGDYLVPNLLPPESPHIGIWGIRRLNFLKQHHNGIYTGLLLSGKLNAHLEEIDCAAITPAIKYPHYNYAIYGNDYLDHWQWFPLTYVYANEYNNFISKLARQLISREKINKLLPVFNFDSVESFIKKCELVEKGI